MRITFQNPYPSETEKKEFVRKTGLTREQVRSKIFADSEK